MKKPSRHSIKNPAIAIKVNSPDAGILLSLVEIMADQRSGTRNRLNKVSSDLQAIQTSSIEADITGDIHLDHNSNIIEIPFTARFLFTCSKGKGIHYNFTWLCSLS